MAAFVIHEKGHPDRVFRIDLPKMIIGRARSAQLVLPNVSVSRRHAQVIRSKDGYVVIDLESQNGTVVNGRRIKRHRLSAGDRVQVGKFILTFHGDDATALRVTDMGDYAAKTDRAASQVTDYVALRQLDKMREVFELKEKARIRLANTDQWWHCGEDGVEFGGKDGIPVKGITAFGKVAELVWDGRAHVLRKTGLLTSTQINARPISEGPLRPGDRIIVGKSHFIYELPQQEQATDKPRIQH